MKWTGKSSLSVLAADLTFLLLLKALLTDTSLSSRSEEEMSLELTSSKLGDKLTASGMFREPEMKEDVIPTARD